MTKGKIKKGGINPIEKKPVVTSPDNIHGDATLEDYEKIAAKIAISSDKIIDEALDKMEQRDKRVEAEKDAMKPEKDSIVAEESVQDSKPEQVPENVEKPLKEPIQNPNIDKIKKENNELRGDIDNLRKSMSGMTIIETEEMFRKEIDSLTSKNDDLILRNSELEFEISRLMVENTALKQKLEHFENSNRIPPQISSRESSIIRQNSQMMGRNEQAYPRGVIRNSSWPSMNGYESWN